MTYPDPMTEWEEDDARLRGHLGEDAHYERHYSDLPCFDECMGCEDDAREHPGLSCDHPGRTGP